MVITNQVIVDGLQGTKIVSTQGKKRAILAQLSENLLENILRFAGYAVLNGVS